MKMTRQVLLCLLFCAVTGMAVDRNKFRTCEQTSFCRRHRRTASNQYQVVKESLEFHVPSNENKKKEEPAGILKSIQRRLMKKDDEVDPYVRGPPPTLTGTLVSNVNNNSKDQQKLHFSLYGLTDGLLRLRVTEVYGQAPHEKARVTYDELVLRDDLQAAHSALWLQVGDERLKPFTEDVSQFFGLQYDDHTALVQLKPFNIQVFANKEPKTPIVTLGSERMYFEVRRLKNAEQPQGEGAQDEPKQDAEEQEEKPEKEIVGYWEDGLAIYADGTREEKKTAEADHRQLQEASDTEGLWEESFGDHKDSKPYGPMSVGMDIKFPSMHLYGIPEHASSATLKPTIGENAHYKDPYRLYNLDVFEYELDETMALYGSIPMVVSQSATSGTAGVFWFNPTETFVDVGQDGAASTTHWISESGIIDVFVMPGPDPPSLYRQYSKLTGTQALPAMFALGYHQCRWNYKDERDVYQVHSKFEELDYPYDVLWLDIEHTDGKRYFTWDKGAFPNPIEMEEKLASQGRRMVTIIDPHIMRDNNYYVHKEATSKGYYVKDKDGKKDFDGWCWPGSSSYLDFTAEKVRNWWAEQFQYSKYVGSTPTLFTWNDMNEPSVFNGPEVTMQKDLRNLNGEEHREWHNLYGMLFHRATTEGQIKRNENHDVRPFVLSRSFFAGTQRYGAIWTGDNTAEWGHLQIASPMLLSLNAAALSFVGADVGGFFGNPGAELFTRWMQAGAYQPFFRGHAHHDSARREPWTFDEETLARLRKVAMERYALLPYWYTVFHQAETTGMPVMRMLWMQYPKTVALFGVDDHFLIGSDLLVRPVVKEGETTAEVLFPTDDLWYDAESLDAIPVPSKAINVETMRVAAPLDKIPVFQRGGSIIARKLRLRRSAMLMKTDPYTLYVALNADKTATGQLYMDDEETFGYQKRNEYAVATFTMDWSAGTLSNRVEIGSGWDEMASQMYKDRMIERIIIMGVDKAPKSIQINGDPLEFATTEHVIVIRKPEVPALADWTLAITH